MSRITIIVLLFSSLVNAQIDSNKLVNSLKYVTDMPYICNGYYITDEGDTIREGCGNAIYWEVISLKEEAIQPLINKLTDTTQTKAPVRFFGGNYTVADVAYTALTEIIHDIPTFELLGVKFSQACGYCSYWWHLNGNIKNRCKFQKAVQKWYQKNKNKLVWIENNNFATCDCFGAHPAGGHFELPD